MGKYRKILVAFDGSESSRNALRQAIMLARTEQSWIKALAVFPSYEGDIDLTGVRNIKDVMKGPSERLISEAMDIAKEEKASVISNVEQGEVYETIVDVAEAENCDLVVLGRKGLGDLERMLMGSVTARVIAHSEKDILVVPRDVKLSTDKILLAVDGSAHSDAALDRALHFARTFKGSLTAVSVVDIYPEFYAEAPEVVENMEKKSVEMVVRVREKVEKSGLKVETKVLRGSAAEEIVGLAREIGAGVIFMGSRGRSGLKKLLMGSVAEKVIGLAPCPVLVAKA